MIPIDRSASLASDIEKSKLLERTIDTTPNQLLMTDEGLLMKQATLLTDESLEPIRLDSREEMKVVSRFNELP